MDICFLEVLYLKNVVNVRFFFEGECLREHTRVGGFLNLYFGPCDKMGSTKPVEIDRNGDNTIVVPEKCLNCDRLSKSNIHGYFCSFEHEIWKDFPRDLDWGEWKPDYPLVGLLHSENSSGYATTMRTLENGANVSKDLIGLLLAKEITKAIVLYRKINVGKTIKEASDELKILIKKLEYLDKDV